jgi:hypothetical protein
MRKTCIRFTLVAGTALAMFAQASAQSSVNFWFNSFGDTNTNQPPIINVVSGSTATLSVYVKTANVGALSGINMLFGYSTSTTSGGSATPADTKASFNTWTWAQTDLLNGQAQAQTGGGGGPSSGTSRPWGYFVSTLNLSSTFGGTGDGVNFKIGDIKLNINATPGNTIPINIWSFGTTDFFASAVVNGQSNEFFPAQPYTATLNVVAAPEPASLAVLGLGALAFIRRRRSK